MKRYLSAQCLLLLLCGCSHTSTQISKAHITNHQGLTQTIINKERLESLERAPEEFQPHYKIVKLYGASEAKKCITTYYPSGHLYQKLTCIQNQARGLYKEWSAEGFLVVEASVLSGKPDVDPESQSTWVFDGECKAFSSSGQLLALFFYKEGVLNAESKTFYPSGALKESLPYRRNLLDGTYRSFFENQLPKEVTEYIEGEKSGRSISFWPTGSLRAKERYLNSNLTTGFYYNQDNTLVSTVEAGKGHKTFWTADGRRLKKQYHEGRASGLVETFSPEGFLERSYFINSQEQKHGKERIYYEQSHQTKLEVSWSNGQVEGPVSTWYPSGSIESEKNIHQGAKHGVLTVWYPDKTLLLVEDYEKGLLKKGRYYPPGSSLSTSEVNDGEGKATLFSPKGVIQKTITYQKGAPIE